MAREFKEVAHLKTDANKYGENWDRIFKKKELKCESCKEPGNEASFIKLDDSNSFVCIHCFDNLY